MTERLAILDGKRQGYKLINENSEIHGPCRHSARFHSFESTEEPGKGEKGIILCQEIPAGPKKKKKKKKKTAPLSQLDPNMVPTHRTLEL